MQRHSNPYVRNLYLSRVQLSSYNMACDLQAVNSKELTMSARAPIWNRIGNTSKQAVVYTPPAVKVDAGHLKVGDVIEMPTIQRLVITDIKSGSEGAVVIGENVLVVYANGYGGVFNDAEAMPIAIPVSAKVNLVSTNLQTTATDGSNASEAKHGGDVPTK